jgi:hypothetical protein
MNDGDLHVVANADAPGKGIAIYSVAPSEILGRAEIEFLRQEALRRYPGKKIYAYMDVDPSLDSDEWLSAYKGQRLHQLNLIIARLWRESES